MRGTRACFIAVLLASVATGVGCTGSTTRADVDLEQAFAYHQQRPADARVSGELGSRTNPVRANGPSGQRDYLHRLRCPDDSSPGFERMGSFGIGPYGKMIDGYSTQCDGRPVSVIYMDLYHCEEETEAVAGFTITPRVIGIPIQNCG